MRKTLIVLFPVIIILLLIGLQFHLSVRDNSNTKESNNKTEKISDSISLRVIIDNNLPDYFEFNGVLMGFTQEILLHYAQQANIKLSVSSESNINRAMEMLATGKADIVVTLPGYKEQFEKKALSLLPTFDHKQYVMLANDKNRHKRELHTAFEVRNTIQGANVIIKRDFTVSKAYNYWLDHISNSALISYDNVYNLMTSLEKGAIDFLVCEKSEADMFKQNFTNTKQVFLFPEEEASTMFVNGLNESLVTSFNQWIAHFKTSSQYEDLHTLYFKNDLSNSIIKRYIADRKRDAISISQYDEIIKEVAQKSGYDWRFISAIAYNESRFKADIISHKGAKGLMQIMPSTDRFFNNSNRSVFNPKTNVEIAVKLMNRIEKSLRFNHNTSDYDKLCIILACYNGGIGHVIDARNLAAKYGENPNDWNSVAKFLKKKSQSEYYNDEIVKQGKFTGIETLNFVSRVMNQYSIYCNKL